MHLGSKKVFSAIMKACYQKESLFRMICFFD
jgi:hypothetical protein